MRVLFVVADAHWTGRARAFATAAAGLVDRGHDVHIACAANCPIHDRLSAGTLSVMGMDPDATTAGEAIQLRREVRARGIDVVFVHTDSEHFTASSALRLAGGTRAVIRRIPPFALAEHGASGRLASRIATSGLLFSTEADRQAAGAARYALPAAVAPLGLDPAAHDGVKPVARDSIGVPSGARVIVAVHDGGDKRGVLTAMRTLSLLASRHPDLHLVIVGAPTLDELRMHGAALGINHMVTLLGGRNDELALLRAADFGWVAAAGDDAAFAALDLMAMKIPVISARSSLMEHYVADGIAGLLLPAADPPATAAAVASFLSRGDQHAAMGAAGRARLQREFPEDAMIAGFERAMQGAVGRAQPVG